MNTGLTNFGEEVVHEMNTTPTITVKKTLRSGQRIEFEGNVLIMGDINPGAEVIAGGDIIVLGKLRGTVHAGAGGERAAQIFAFQMNPVQIWIADVIARGADKVKRIKDLRPEVAKIKENQIVVEKFNP
jgi:septum site-determining protein MinC